MGDEEKTVPAQKPTTLELRHSNNIMIDKTVLIPPAVADNIMNNDSEASAVSSMVVCSTLSDTTTTSADGCNADPMTKSEQDLLNGNDTRADEVDPAKQAAYSALDDNEPNINESDGLLGEGTPIELNGTEQPCAMFGQMIDHDDETLELLSDVAAWESAFPKEMLNEYENQVASPSEDSDIGDLPPGWKKICDSSGSYYWNIESGITQSQHPGSNINSEESRSDLTSTQSTDTIKAAATDIQQMIISTQSRKDAKRWSGNSREGHLFLVRSLGWLPIEHADLKPDISSAAVNSCIRLLSNNRSQIMDGVGVWGEGKDLMLLLNEDHLKIVDPLEDTVLQSQLIRHIRVWGVGRDSAHDFAYVVRDPTTRVYKCHVFRCDAPAQSIAKQLHTMCSILVQQKKLAAQKRKQETQGLNANIADEIPVASAEPCQSFPAKYMGAVKVAKPSGIKILKQAILDLMRGLVGNGSDVKVSVSPSALTVSDGSSDLIVNCRMRCLSFMGVGDDIQLFGFISVLGGEATCHVLQCTPNAAKLAVAVQEACMLRYQKAIDSKQPVKNSNEHHQNKSLKSKALKLFSGWRNSRS